MLEGDGVGIFEKVIFLQILWMLIIEVWGWLLNLWRKQNSKKKAETLILGKKNKRKRKGNFACQQILIDLNEKIKSKVSYQGESVGNNDIK